MDRPRISIFSIFILLLLLVEFVIPFRDLVIPAWNTLIIPANIVKSIIALILLMLMGIYLYVQIKKIPKR